MVSDDVSIALNLIQLIALTLPVIAILMQAMVAFQRNQNFDWRGSTSGLHQVLIEKRFAFLFYSFLALYLGLCLCLVFLYTQIQAPPLLFAVILSLLLGFGLILLGVAAFTWNIDSYISEEHI